MVTYVALPYQMFQLTHSSLKVGLLGLAELVPLLVTAFVGGALADTVDRRRMVLATEIGLGLGSGALALAALHGTPPVWTLYVVAAVMSALNGLQRPSLEALAPRLVDQDEMPAVASLAHVPRQHRDDRRPGPGRRADRLRRPRHDLPLRRADLRLLLLRASGRSARCCPRKSRRSPSLRGVLDGFRYARSRQELIGTYVVDFVAMVFGMPLALFPAIAAALGRTEGPGPPLRGAGGGGARRQPDQPLGVARAPPRPGGDAGGHRLGAGDRGLRPQRRAGARPPLPGLAGGADCVSGMFRMTLWNQTIPDTLRGRLAGIEMVSYMSGPLLGHVEAG